MDVHVATWNECIASKPLAEFMAFSKEGLGLQEMEDTGSARLVMS